MSSDTPAPLPEETPEQIADRVGREGKRGYLNTAHATLAALNAAGWIANAAEFVRLHGENEQLRAALTEVLEWARVVTEKPTCDGLNGLSLAIAQAEMLDYEGRGGDPLARCRSHSSGGVQCVLDRGHESCHEARSGQLLWALASSEGEV